MFVYLLFIVALVLGSVALLLWNIRRIVTALARALAFNTGGGSPMARLVPNVAFLALFLLLLNATWF